MPAFKPAYLIHGDDHGRVGERRANLRAVAESESGSGGVEQFEGEAATPEAVAAALAAMTFAVGRRFLIVDGVERFKDADVKKHLAGVMADMPPDTTIAFFGREEGRFKVPAALIAAVEGAGGAVAVERTLKAKELPRWLQGEARKLGIELDQGGAQALVAQIGERQQRLLREVEKLAIEHGPGVPIGAEEVEQSAAHSAERQVWGLVDALMARDREAATRSFLALDAQGESVARLAPLIARRVRDVYAIAARLEAGETPAQIKPTLKMNPWVADRRIAEARRSDADSLRRALEALADLELTTHGASDTADETAALRAIALIAS